MSKAFIKANSFGPDAGSRTNNLCFPARPPVQVSTDCFIRIGISVEAFQKVITLWPEINDDVEGSDSFLVVNNSLNELCNGPDSPSEKDWAKYFNASRDDIAQSYKKWAESLDR